MMNNLLDYILESEDIFKPITKEEIPIRHRQYLKSVFDKLEKEGKLIYNEDGTVDVNDDLYLEDIGLTSLLDLPYKIRKITGSFYCSYNKLISLEGAPEQVGGNFWCYNNQLISLKGAPREVGGWFSCENNKLPEDVKIPSEVKGKIYR